MKKCKNCKGHEDMNWQVELIFLPKIMCPICFGKGKKEIKDE